MYPANPSNRDRAAAAQPRSCLHLAQRQHEYRITTYMSQQCHDAGLWIGRVPHCQPYVAYCKLHVKQKHPHDRIPADGLWPDALGTAISRLDTPPILILFCHIVKQLPVAVAVYRGRKHGHLSKMLFAVDFGIFLMTRVNVNLLPPDSFMAYLDTAFLLSQARCTMACFIYPRRLDCREVIRN